jgi:hypothetical protein
MLFPSGAVHDFARPLAERANSRRHVGPYRITASGGRGGVAFYRDSDGACARYGSPFALRLEPIPSRGVRFSSCYSVNDEGDAYTPMVARLPRGRGFLAVWSLGHGMISFLDRYVFTTKGAAAASAHDSAERAAHDQRVYEESERERMDADDLAEVE